MKNDIYISYSNKDAILVNELCDALDAYKSSSKLDYFFGYKDKTTISDYVERVSDIIAESKVLLFVASKESLADVYCSEELNLARQKGIKIYCYQIDDAELPSHVRESCITLNSATMSLNMLLSEVISYAERSSGQDSSVILPPEPLKKNRVLLMVVAVLLALGLGVVAKKCVGSSNNTEASSETSSKTSNPISNPISSATHPSSIVEDVKNLGMKMIYVDGGGLRPYYIAECEVTQAQWKKIMGTSINDQCNKQESATNTKLYLRGKGANHPMYYVSWHEAKSFCERLSELTGREYKLPTEKEWEYAARGGKKSRGYIYSGSDNLDDVAWNKWNSSIGNSDPVTHRVKALSPNELGLYDMSGNVWEWCLDYYGADTVDYRVIRGGSCMHDENYCQVTESFHEESNMRRDRMGFRVVYHP